MKGPYTERKGHIVNKNQIPRANERTGNTGTLWTLEFGPYGKIIAKMGATRNHLQRYPLSAV